MLSCVQIIFSNLYSFSDEKIPKHSSYFDGALLMLACIFELLLTANRNAFYLHCICFQPMGMIFTKHVFLFSASEPNLKVRSALKQKVMERRITQSPILRRRDKGFLLKRKTPLSSMYE